MPTRTDAPLCAGVELGGTKCICVLGTGPEDIRAEVRVETRAPAGTLAALARTVSQWCAGHPVRALGIASFGPADLDPRSAHYGSLVGTPKPGWDAIPIVAAFRPLGIPIGFDTDVNAAALAEGQWGGARGLDAFAYVTVGTGIGAGSVVGGHSLRGLSHGEAGHMRIARLAGDTWPGSCPFHGDCAEGLASGPAIQARTGMPAATLPAEHPAWDAVAHALGGLFHNLVLATVPERILVGGGVVAHQPQLLPRVRTALVRSLNGYAHGARIARAPEQFLCPPQLGERAGSLGAIALAQRTLR
ncbi:MAG: ROK family protein [Proteobacteria bacterium]|nr:ROK family protein [Pseudomonadota bacterium]